MKRVNVRRIFPVLAILLIAASLLTLPSCKRRYDKEEVLTAAEELLRRGEILNAVYYGKGISHLTTGYSNGAYYEADPYHLRTLGFETIDELKRLTEQTFTVGYSLQIYSTVLSSISDEDGLYVMARYYQQNDVLEPELPVCIMVYAGYEGIYDGNMTYDYSTLAVDGVKKERVYVTVDAEVRDDKGNTQTTTIRVTLIEEDNGWRIDSPTWANYNPDADRYNDLINK
jgi:hypothetical protein